MLKYKGYRICANANFTRFWDIDKDGERTEEVQVNYEAPDEDSEIWYSVVDKDGWCIMSFETIEECKQHIRENE